MSVIHRKLLLASTLVYLVCLCAPIDGMMFSGVTMLVVSLFGVFAMLAHFDPATLTSAGRVAGLTFFLLPFYNPLLIYALARLRRRSYQPSLALQVMLGLAAAHAAVVTVLIGTETGAMVRAPALLFGMWTLALLLAAVAAVLQHPAALALTLEPGYTGD
jgi:hypothetical protein